MQVIKVMLGRKPWNYKVQKEQNTQYKQTKNTEYDDTKSRAKAWAEKKPSNPKGICHF